MKNCIHVVEVVSLIQNILAIDCSLTYSRMSILPGKTLNTSSYQKMSIIVRKNTAQYHRLIIMSVICFCFLYILDNCLFTVNVFAPQFNVYCNCEPSFITNEDDCRLFHAIFMMLSISMNYLFQLLMYIPFFVMVISLPHRSSSLFYFANLMLYNNGTA